VWRMRCNLKWYSRKTFTLLLNSNFVPAYFEKVWKTEKPKMAISQKFMYTMWFQFLWFLFLDKILYSFFQLFGTFFWTLKMTKNRLKFCEVFGVIFWTPKNVKKTRKKGQKVTFWGPFKKLSPVSGFCQFWGHFLSFFVIFWCFLTFLGVMKFDTPGGCKKRSPRWKNDPS
jgi:hypothetical protein